LSLLLLLLLSLLLLSLLALHKHDVSQSDLLDIVKLLVNKNINVNSCDSEGFSCLWVAIHYLGKDNDVTLYLIEQGAFKNHLNLVVLLINSFYIYICLLIMYVYI